MPCFCYHVEDRNENGVQILGSVGWPEDNGGLAIRMKQKTYYLWMTILATVFLGSGAMLVKNFLENRQHEAEFAELASQFPEAGAPGQGGSAGLAGAGQGDGLGDGGRGQAAGHEGGGGSNTGQESGKASDIPPQDWKLWWERETEGRLATYQSLKEQNADMVGWVRIEGTKVDYPVMQTPDRPDYYLHRDFNKKKSNYGIPYMAENCRYEEPGASLLIYGHHMRNGGMFAALQGYTEEAFYRQHPYIQFDTLNQAGSYEIVAVVKVNAADSTIPWQELLFPKNQETFEAAWADFGKQSFYRTGVEPAYGQRLLALVTCEYTLKDGRLMVVAREIP